MSWEGVKVLRGTRGEEQGMLAYVKGFIVLFVLLALLLYLPPGKNIQKYIHFFAGLVLTMGLAAPLLSLLFDSGELLELIRYEEFSERLSGISRDMNRIEYAGQDYVIAQYEEAIGADVRQLAEQYGCPVTDVRVKLTEAYEVERIEIYTTYEEKTRDEGDDEEKDTYAETEGRDTEEQQKASQDTPGETGANIDEIVVGEIVLGDGEQAENGQDTGMPDAGDAGKTDAVTERENEKLRAEYDELIRAVSTYYRVDASQVGISGRLSSLP